MKIERTTIHGGFGRYVFNVAKYISNIFYEKQGRNIRSQSKYISFSIDYTVSMRDYMR